MTVNLSRETGGQAGLRCFKMRGTMSRMETIFGESVAARPHISAPDPGFSGCHIQRVFRYRARVASIEGGGGVLAGNEPGFRCEKPGRFCPAGEAWPLDKEGRKMLISSAIREKTEGIRGRSGNKGRI